MAKVEHGSYTAWTVNGTPRYMKDGKMMAGKNMNPEIKQELDTLLGAADSDDVDADVQDVQDATKQGDERTARLEAQVEVLMSMLQAQQGATPHQNAPQTTKTPYSLDLSIYDSPVKALMEWAMTDRRMLQQAFTTNYELQFVRETPARYPLADGSYQQVPKFTLGLLEYAYDDDGEYQTRINERGEQVQIKYLRKRLVMFEDPDYALMTAYNKGLKLDDQTSQQFLNDMRLLQAKDWLLEVFYPPKSTNAPGMKEEAIGGQMVTIIESPTQWKDVNQTHKLKV